MAPVTEGLALLESDAVEERGAEGLGRDHERVQGDDVAPHRSQSGGEALRRPDDDVGAHHARSADAASTTVRVGRLKTGDPRALVDGAAAPLDSRGEPRRELGGM